MRDIVYAPQHGTMMIVGMRPSSVWTEASFQTFSTAAPASCRVRLRISAWPGIRSKKDSSTFSRTTCPVRVRAARP